VTTAAATGLRAAPFIWGARTDVAAFGGSCAIALAFVALGHATGLSQSALPGWTYLAFILAIDVAHVYSTLFRTYLDREELGRRPRLYVALPLVAWALGTALHLASPAWFWRALAYLAVFHFVRQQAGWVAIYRGRAGQRGTFDRVLDDAAIYLAAGVPLLVWHATLPRKFSWFVAGDFVDAAWLARAVVPMEIACAVVLLAFFVRQAQLARVTRVVPIGKLMIVTTTALAWWIGIVLTNSDLDFTVTNVTIHGVPYMVLLWHYGQARKEEAPRALGSRIVASGVGAFFGLLVALAFIEEMAWDHLVWHEHAWLFGGLDAGGAARSLDPAPDGLPPVIEAMVVALLAVPQATHYAIDAFLWRRRDTTLAQARALGFGGLPD
jgi:hypothetical protein